MEKSIRLHFFGMDLQKTMIRQHELMDSVEDLVEQYPDISVFIRTAAALGLDHEGIEWALSLPYVNYNIDPAFVLGLMILCDGTRDLINLDLLQDASYREVMMDLCEKITTDPESEERDAAFRTEIQELITAVREAQKEFNQTIKTYGTKQTGKSKSINTDINEAKYAEMQRIIGDAHLTDSSPTYKDLYEWLHAARKEVEAARAEVAEYQKELAAIGKERDRLEEEVEHVRRNIPMMAPVPVMPKRRFPWRRWKSEEVQAERHQPETWEELISSIVSDTTLTDSQVIFLSRLLKDHTLSLQEMQEIADPALTVTRMQVLASLYYARSGKELPIDTNTDTEAGVKEALPMPMQTPDTSAALAPVPDPVYVEVGAADFTDSGNTRDMKKRYAAIVKKIGGKNAR